MVSSHPNISEAAAIAVKVSEEGRYSEDEVMIVVVLEEGKDLAPEEIIEFLKPIMPKFMIPRFIKFRDNLPKTPTNRVQKVKLREEGVTSDTWDSLKNKNNPYPKDISLLVFVYKDFSFQVENI